MSNTTRVRRGTSDDGTADPAPDYLRSASFRSFVLALVSDLPPVRRPAQRSPVSETRSRMVRSENVLGSTSPRSISVHVHGADTGAPARARTVYAAAKVAL